MGLQALVFPEAMVRLSGDDPIYPGWLRWTGGTLMAIGADTIMVFRKPENQRIFVITIALVTLLAGLSLSFSLLGMDEDDNFIFAGTPAFLLLLISTLLWIGQWKARDYLGSFK